MSTTKSQNDYYNWIDVAKFVGLYLMVLGHGLVPERNIQFIYSFHMPLFFVLSGLLFKNRGLSTSIRKGIRTLIIPYFLLNAIGLLYDVVEKHLVGKTLSLCDIYDRIGAILMGIGYNVDNWHPVLSPTWYIYTLFLIQSVCSLSRNELWYFMLLPLSIALTLFLSHNSIDLLIPFDSAFLAMPFFLFGMLLKNRNTCLKGVWGGVIVTCLFALMIVSDTYQGRVDINRCEYGRNLILFYLSGLAGSMLVIGLCQNIQNISLRKYMSGGMLVVAFNLIVIGYFQFFFKMAHMDISLLQGLILAIVIMAMFYPVIIVSRRFFPALIGYRNFREK